MLADRMPSALIVNPYASSVNEERIDAVQRALGEPEVLRTERAGHAAELARAAEEWADAIYVFSGDGGFNEALNGAGGEVPLGFLPGGGANVLPRALGLPRDPVAAARRLAERRTRRIALGRANGRRFAFSCGIGIDAEAVRRIDARGRRPDGKRPGNLAFSLAVARLVLDGSYAEPALEVAELEPSNTVLQGRQAAFALVGNVAPYTYAGRIAVRPHPRITPEGGLDFVAPARFRRRSLPRYAAYVLSGRGVDTAADLAYGHDLDRLLIRCLRPLPVQVDGEDLGDATEVVLEAERDAVTVLV
jgi:diacylglycerol kinase family enzyme